MLQNESNDNDRKEVKGDFPVSFHYTAGIAIEKVWKGFVDKKLLPLSVMIVIIFFSRVGYFVRFALVNLVKKIG